MRAGLAAARRLLNSASVLGFVVLGLYLFKGIFHMIVFPGTTDTHRHYHYNAPLVMLARRVAAALHGLGAQLAGPLRGLALMAGSISAHLAARI